MMAMKLIEDGEFGRRFRAAVARAAVEGEEIVVTHQSRKVARIIPEPVRQTAREAMADLGRTLGAEACAAWSQRMAAARGRGRKTRKGTLKELRHPWAS
jgi:antitoxin (DNA-binding transcriptional repressor) of toxin-antitoxin stability system